MKAKFKCKNCNIEREVSRDRMTHRDWYECPSCGTLSKRSELEWPDRGRRRAERAKPDNMYNEKITVIINKAVTDILRVIEGRG